MKCQSLFSEKNITDLSSAEFTQRVETVKTHQSVSPSNIVIHQFLLKFPQRPRILCMFV